MDTSIFHSATLIGPEGRILKASALAVGGGRILGLGERIDLENRFPNVAARFDLSGRTVVPAFTDSHIHLLEAGDCLSSAQLTGLDFAGILEVLRADEAVLSPGETLVGRGWEADAVGRPNLETLDRAFPTRPVFLFSKTWHTLWFNSAAARAYGLFSLIGVRDPIWSVTTDSEGRPTGLLEEPYECPVVQKFLSDRNRQPAFVRRAIQAIVPALHRAGITSVHDNTWDPQVLRLIQPLLRGIDVLSFPYGLDTESLPQMLAAVDPCGPCAVGPVKFFVDGIFGTRTAWLWEPYRNDGGNCGKGLSADQMIQRIEPFVALGRQLAFHVVGDRAVSELCDALEILAIRYPQLPEQRTRFEHTQLLRDEDLPRLKRLGVVVSAQPPACASFLRDLTILGEDRALRAYPHRTLVDAGIPLAFGCDFPSEDFFAPLESLRTIALRPSRERLELPDVLKAYTQGSAYAGFQESYRGTLEEGKDADFAILSGNPLHLGALREEIRVDQTVRRGQSVFERARQPLYS